MKLIANANTLFARGIYDKFHDKIIICAQDIMISSITSIRSSGGPGDYHKTFGLVTYFTLIHEMLHKANVAKDGSEGHKIDFDRFEKLPPVLQDLFDGLLEMEYSNDNFTNHPENRRDK